MGWFTAAYLLTAGSRHWAPEGRSGNKLATNQPGLYWSSNRTVSETISLNHCSEARPCWTFFWLAVWLLSACYISVAYVYHVYDITNENEMLYFILPTLYSHWPTFFATDSMGLSLFKFLWWAPKYMFCATEWVMAVQGHPRSLILATI